MPGRGELPQQEVQQRFTQTGELLQTERQQFRFVSPVQIVLIESGTDAHLGVPGRMRQSPRTRYPLQKSHRSTVLSQERVQIQ